MKFGIIGHPVSHSQSPRLFAEAFPNSGHTYDIIEEGNFEKAFAIFMADYDAVNVTMPFKELAFFACQPSSAAVRTMQAVNILKKENGKVMGYNSDYLGVKDIIERRGLSGSRVLTVGCGGAAKAAAIAAFDAGCEVSITNRSFEKCHSFVRHFAPDLHAMELDKVSMDDYDLVIYAVPGPVEQLSGWNFAGKTVLEANYANPCLREKILGEGGIYIEGLEWLRAQADSGFKILLSL